MEPHGPIILFPPFTTCHVAKLWHNCGKVCDTRLGRLLVMLKNPNF